MSLTNEYDERLEPLHEGEAETPGGTTEVMGVSWLPIDLGEVVDGLQNGTLKRPQPTLGRLPDGRCLFYAGRVNGLHGDSTAGKTWTVLVICCQELAKGEQVLFIDLEDDALGVVGRLLSLGADPRAVTERFHYVRPEERCDDIARSALLERVQQIGPTLAIVDTTGEALAMEGKNPNADDEVASWMRRIARSIANCGPGVVLNDHVPKSNDGATPLQPIGSQRKRSAITGASYAQDCRVPFSQHRTGHSRLRCGKDRGGNYSTGEHVADLHVGPGVAGVAELTVAEVTTTTDGAFRPTVLMERVSRFIEDNPGSSWYAVRSGVKGKTDAKRTALNVLVSEGWIFTKPGDRNSTTHTCLTPFREATEAEGTGRPAPDRPDLSLSLGEGTGGQVISPVPGDRSGTGGDRCQKCGSKGGPAGIGTTGHCITCEAADRFNPGDHP